MIGVTIFIKLTTGYGKISKDEILISKAAVHKLSTSSAPPCSSECSSELETYIGKLNNIDIGNWNDAIITKLLLLDYYSDWSGIEDYSYIGTDNSIDNIVITPSSLDIKCNNIHSKFIDADDFCKFCKDNAEFTLVLYGTLEYNEITHRSTFTGSITNFKKIADDIY